jgi:hypothetical protein
MPCKLQEAFFSSIAKLQVKGFISKLDNFNFDKVFIHLAGFQQSDSRANPLVLIA